MVEKQGVVSPTKVPPVKNKYSSTILKFKFSKKVKINQILSFVTDQINSSQDISGHDLNRVQSSPEICIRSNLQKTEDK